MKVDCESRNGLERCLTVELSEERFNRELKGFLQLLGKNLETDVDYGSGDISEVLEQKFGEEIREKVLDRVFNYSFAEAIHQSELEPVGKPAFDIVQPASDNGFSYNAVFEVYPSVTLPDLSAFKFTQLVADVNEEDVDRTISVLRRQEAKWCLVDRPASTGDSVIINYHAQVGEKVFDGKAMRVELNSDDVVEGFEKGLTGVSAGDKLPVELYFPGDHYQTEVAGKAVIFDVEVLQVEAMVLPELDDDFIAAHGIESGSVETLRHVIRHNMDVHLQKVIRMKNTLTILTEILQKYPVDVPQILLEQEVMRLTCDPCEEVEGVDSFKHEMDPAMFADLAHKRVARSLMTAELASANGIELDTAEVRLRLEDLVEEYSDKERIIEWFYEDTVRLASIESDVLGEQVADWIIQTTQAEKVNTTYNEMMNLTDAVTV